MLLELLETTVATTNRGNISNILKLMNKINKPNVLILFALVINSAICFLPPRIQQALQSVCGGAYCEDGPIGSETQVAHSWMIAQESVKQTLNMFRYFMTFLASQKQPVVLNHYIKLSD